MKKHGHNWKGGIRKNTQGYIEQFSPGHPRAKNRLYVRQHILIVEKVLGRFLRENEMVHHVNSNPSDNRKGNLVLCPNMKYHKLLHIRTNALKACGNAGWLKCSYCGEYDDPQNMYVYKTKIDAFHRECHSKYELSRYYKNKEKSA